MSRVRVAHFVTSFELGGVQSVVDNLAHAQVREGFDVMVCGLVGPVVDYNLSGNLEEHLQYIQFGWPRANYLRGLSAIIKFLRQNKIQILHTHPGTLSRLAGILAGVPVIVSTIHTSMTKSNFAIHAFNKWLACHTSAFVANSKSTQEYFTSLLGLPTNLVKRIYNGVDTKRFRNVTQDCTNIREKYKIPDDTTVVVTTSRLHPDKGIDILISAAVIVLKIMPTMIFLIVGDGECRQKLKKQAELYGIEKAVHFLGARNDVRPFLESSDIFVLPSAFREGFGMSIVEAMAMGLPVVGTRLGGIPEIIEDGVNGLLVPPRDANSLARAIIRLEESPELATRLAQNGQQMTLEKFTQERMFNQYQELYYSLLG